MIAELDFRHGLHSQVHVTDDSTLETSGGELLIRWTVVNGRHTLTYIMWCIPSKKCRIGGNVDRYNSNHHVVRLPDTPAFKIYY